MAKSNKRESLEDLIGNSITVKSPGEVDVIVPVDKTGNRIANMVLAAQSMIACAGLRHHAAKKLACRHTMVW